MKPKNIILIALIIIVAILVGFFTYIHEQKKAFDEDKKAFVEVQKKALQEELNTLQTEYETQYNRLKLNNGERPMVFNTDSLLNKLLVERNRVDRLKEELQSVRSTSAKQITILTNEVGTLKTLLRSYIVQVDSLNTLNQRLSKENQKVKESYQKVSKQNAQLTKEKESLADKVSVASRLDASNLKVVFLDSRDRETSRIYRIKKIAITFTIPKNVTAQVGYKSLYARILDPNDTLIKNDEGTGFSYDGKTIEYSIKRDIEYKGEDMNVSMYLNINTSLLEGSYRLAIFADGYMIANRMFSIQ